MPKTKFGKWSIGCLGLFIVLLLLAWMVVASGQAGGETFFDNLYILIPMLLAGVFGVLAFVFGLYNIIKQKERSLLVFITSFIGLLILGFVAGEFLGPAH